VVAAVGWNKCSGYWLAADVWSVVAIFAGAVAKVSCVRWKKMMMSQHLVG